MRLSGRGGGLARAGKPLVSQSRGTRLQALRFKGSSTSQAQAPEAQLSLTPDEQAELRELLEENTKLRQAVSKSTSKLNKEQLEKLTLEYNNLVSLAERAGLKLENGDLAQQLAAPKSSSSKAPSAPAKTRSAPKGSTGRSSAQPSRGSSTVSTPVVSPTTPTPASPWSTPDVSGRAYAKDVATVSVELDATMDEDSDDESPAYAAGVAAAAFSKGRSGVASQRFASRLGNDVFEPPEQVDQAPARQSKAAAAAQRKAELDAAKAAEAAQKAAERAAAEAAAAAAKAKEVARKAARQAVSTAEKDLRAVVAGREHWMIVTVPENPVAGEECLILFNRAQSASLRVRPRITMLYAFNRWELVPEPNKLDLLPAPLPKAESTDFWSCKFTVPQEAFELNFVFSDNENLYENNDSKDFMLPVEAGLTYEEWLDMSAQWTLEREVARKEAERKAAEEAERQRQEALIKSDEETGKRMAQELLSSRVKLQEHSLTVFKREGKLLWDVTPTDAEAGGKLTLRYNRKASSIGWFDMKQGAVNLLYGFNGWKKSGKIAMKPSRGPLLAEPEDEWWEASVELPYEAVVMNFVLNAFEHYDNNNRQDYAVPIFLPEGETSASWGAKLAELFRKQEYEARVAREEEARRKQVIKDEKRRRAQDLVKAVERRKVRHVLFTEPEVVQAGEEVTIFYNPRDTILNGRQAIYVLGGWNRWNHPRPFGPIQMNPPMEGETHFWATVTVPKDAYKMDFVFADVPSGDGTYDNRGGFDYHLPVEGSVSKEKGLHVVHISVEMAPIAKVGGLGDVVTALGRAVKEQGHMVEVIMPKYDFLNGSPILNGQMRYEAEFDWGGTRIYVTTAVVENLRVFFIEPKNGFFATQSVYGRYDDEVRFDFFCKAALEFLLKTGRQPDILHCHDWSTAHVASSYWNDYHNYGLWKPKVVFTIHNLNYGQKKITEAALSCQKFTTVSPTYAYETGGHPAIASQVHKFIGIRNGIDPELWSPEENQWLPTGYSSETVVEGKKAARKALRERLNLTSWNDKFIVGVVSRLTGQKGVPLIKHAAYRALERGGQFVLLGSAPDPKIQADFDNMARTMGGQDAAFCFKYDEPLSHLIYAACDMIIVPSMFEPCGLTQMIAMRYGAVPIVRHTGGLRDTVFDVDFDKERAAWDVYGSSDWQRDNLDATNGFAFTGTDGGALDYAMNRAIDAWYNDREWFHSLQQRVMEQDWSWNRPALDYIELYFSAIKA